MTPEASLEAQNKWLQEHIRLLKNQVQSLKQANEVGQAATGRLTEQRDAAEKRVGELESVVADCRKYYMDIANAANAEAYRFQTLLRESEAKVERLQADAKSTRRYENGLEDGRAEMKMRVEELEALAYIGEPHPGSSWKDYCHEVGQDLRKAEDKCTFLSKEMDVLAKKAYIKERDLETMVASLQTALKEMEVERDAWKSTYLTAKAKEWKLIQPWRYPENK